MVEGDVADTFRWPQKTPASEGVRYKSEIVHLKVDATGSTPVRVVLYVDGFVHGGCGGVGFFVGVDGAGVEEGCADVVEAFEQNFLARGGDFKLIGEPVIVLHCLARQ